MYRQQVHLIPSRRKGNTCADGQRGQDSMCLEARKGEGFRQMQVELRLSECDPS